MTMCKRRLQPGGEVWSNDAEENFALKTGESPRKKLQQKQNYISTEQVQNTKFFDSFFPLATF